MKNIKIYLAVSLIALFSLSLAACDGVAFAETGISLQNSGYARGADDSNYNTPSSSDSGAMFSSSTDSSSADSSFSSSELKFKGAVEDVTANTLTINGITFTVDTQVDLTTLFTAGSMFQIEYKQNQDGTISILQFNAEDETSIDSSEDYDVEFKGMVEEVTADTIMLNGETFTVTTQEALTTLFTAGEFYEIKYVFNPDGTITIVSFHLEDDSTGMFGDSSDDMDDSSDDHDDNSSNSDNDDSNDDSNHDNSNDNNSNNDD